MAYILFCGPVSKSLEHLSFYCPLAHSVLSWLQSSPLAPSLICRRALFGFNSDELLFVTRSFVYILGVLKLFIWYARNAFAFAMFVLDLPQSSRMLKLVLALIFLCIPKVCIFKRRNFHRQWGGCGAVPSVVRGCLVLQLHLHGPNLGLCLTESGQLLHGHNLDVKPSLYVSCPLAFGAGSPILVYCTVVAFMSCRPCRVVLSEFLCLVDGVRELATFSRGFPTLGEPANWLCTPATLMKETVGQQTIDPPPPLGEHGCRS